MQTFKRAYRTLVVVLLVACGEPAGGNVAKVTFPPCTSQVRFRMPDNPPLTTYTYDAQRREVGRETRSSAGLVTARGTHEYDAAGFLARARSESATAAGVATLDNIVETIWVYTSDHRAYVAETTDNGVLSERARAVLNAAGDPERVTFEIGGGSTTYRYNENGHLTERTTMFDDGSPSSTTMLSYRADGLLEREVEGFGGGVERVSVYAYEGDLLVRKSRLASNGTDEEVWTEYEYDDQGRLVLETTYVPVVDPDSFNMQTEYTYACWDEE